jgi:hypothetical protein
MKVKNIIGATCGVVMFFVCSALAASVSDHQINSGSVLSIEYHCQLG